MSTNFGQTSVDIKWADLNVVENIARKVALKGLAKLSHEILGEAKKNVPVKTGMLKDSGNVSVDSKNSEITISFNTPYARKIHETHSSKAKYLERPFNELKGKAQFKAEEAITDYYIKHKYNDEAILKDKGITE